MRLALVAAVLGAGLPACTVDTETGVGAEVDGAVTTIRGDGATTVVSVAIDARFRVGEHASGTRTFRAPRADVFVAAGPFAASVNLDRPTDFDGMLSPGEEDSVHLVGATIEGAFPDARALLCGAAVATLILHYEDTTAMEMATVEAGTSVACE